MTTTIAFQPRPVPLYTYNIDHSRKRTPVRHLEVSPRYTLEMSNAACPKESATGAKRTRKAHHKVRTGCLTCKIRRKKCDEAKPACVRCTSTGRKCDGYAVPEAPLSTDSVDRQNRSSPASSTVLAIQKPTDLIPSEPKIVELDTDGTVTPMMIDNTVDETEVSDFILSYTGTISSENSTLSSPYTPSTVSSPRSESTSPAVILHPHKRPRRHLNIVPRSPGLFSQNSKTMSIDSSCFSYFRHITGPSFASYFDSSIWRNYTINAALAHPAVFSAAAALGAVHRRFMYGISREAFEYCAHAARLHTKAVRELEELKAQSVNKNMIGTASTGGCGMGVYDRDVIMTGEMLLSIFEGFQSNHEAAVEHLNNGMQYLLARPMTLVHSESRYCAVESNPNTFCRLFHQLHCRALQLFGSPTQILVHWGDGLPLPAIPEVFTDLEEARDLLFTEVDWIMHAPARIWEDERERSEAQNLHVHRLLRWSVAYADTVKIMERTPTQKKACMLMKLTRNAAYLLLYLTLFVTVDPELPKMPGVDEEIDNDPEQDGVLAFATKALWEMVQKREYLNTNLARIKVTVDAMLDEHSIFSYDEHSLSFDSAIGPPRTGKKLPDSSSKTRHLIKTMLKRNAGTEREAEVFEMLGVYGVAERVSALEEHAVISAIRAIIPENLDPKWVCITCMMESRKILLRYCRPDEQGLGMMWVQEWWAF